MHKAYTGILTAVLIVSIGAAFLLGSTYVAPMGLIQGDYSAWQVVMNYRLPRIIVAIIGGAMIGWSSILIQLVLRNKLVDASILGVMNGTQFMMLVVIVLLPALTNVNVFIASLCGIIICIGWRIVMPKRSSSMTLILIGIATAMTFQSLTQLTTTGFGMPIPTLSTVTWTQTIQVLIMLLVGIMLLIIIWPKLKYFAISSEQLRLLQIPETKIIYLVMVIIGIWSGAVTSVLGVIFFLGAVLPQMARYIFPHAKSQALFIPTGLCGSVLLLNADTIARTVLSPTELPTGAVLLAISGPLFVLLLMKGAR